MPRCRSCLRRLPYSTPCPLDGLSVHRAETDASVVAPVVEGVKLERLAARGGFSDVWRARHGDALLALKVSRRAADAPRAEREASALARVGVPFAPRVELAGQLADGRPYLGMEWLDHPTLAAWLEACAEPPPLTTALAIGSALLTCLEHVHARGVLHRDWKPENLVVVHGCEPRAIALDFGSCQFGEVPAATPALSEDALTETGLVIASDEYVAPERLRGEAADERSDVYSAAVMLYELFTLRVPFASGRATWHAHLTLAPPPPSSFASVPPLVEQLLLECLAKQPAARPSFADLRARWDRLGSTPSTFAPPAGASVPSLGRVREAAVLLRCEGVRDPLRLVQSIEGRSGVVARLDGATALAVFGSTGLGDPVDAALAATAALASAGVVQDMALHLDVITRRRTPDGVFTAYGPAVDEPETWLGARPSGVTLTRAFALAAGSERMRRFESEHGLTCAPAGDSARTPTGDADEPPLLGRDAVLAALSQSLRLTLASGAPGFVVLTGEPASGKSRMAREAAELARRAGVAVIESVGGLGPSLAVSPGAVAVVIDDAHWADPAALDALEVSALAGARAVWVVCIGSPSFSATRPLFGRRATNSAHLSLSALAPEPARALAAHCLLPAEYVPEQALDLLTQAAGALPGSITELCRGLHAAGLIRTRPETHSEYLDTSSLDCVPLAHMWQWLAARQIEPLEPAIAAGVKLMAVLGPSFERDQLEWVQARLGTFGAGAHKPDPGVLLESSVRRELLAQVPGGREQYRFRSAPLAAALAELVEPADRTEIHRLALTSLQSSATLDEATLESLVRHALALDERRLARDTLRRLAETLADSQRLVDAEARTTRAMELFAADDPALLELGIARATLRCRLYRLAEAADDLRSVAENAARLDRAPLAARALFELATVLDWAGDYAGSAQAASSASEHSAGFSDQRLQARALVAEGRSAWRRGDVSFAIDSLESGLRAAEGCGCTDSRVIAQLLLGCALVQAGSPERGAAHLDAVVEHTAAVDDRLHLCAALGNRAFVRAVRGEVAGCLEDLTRAVDVARRLGHPGTERTALLNLAEVLYWAGREHEALPLLHQARALEERFLHRPVHSAVLLLARIAAMRGDYAAARAELELLSERALPEPHVTNAVAFTSAVFHVLSRSASACRLAPVTLLSWADIEAAAPSLLEEERFELAFWQAHFDALSSEARGAPLEPGSPIAGHPVWAARLRNVASSAS